MPEKHRENARELQDMLWDLPPADWVLEMQDHYRRTGWYRPEDLRRLLGDPTGRSTSGPNSSLMVRLEEMVRENRATGL